MAQVGETMGLVTELILQKENFIKSIAQAKDAVGSFSEFAKRGLESIGIGFSVYEIVNTFKEASREVENLYTATKKLGISIESFQALDFAAEKYGVTVGQVTTTLQLMQRGLGEAEINPNSNPATALKLLGLSFNELKDLSPDQQFVKISESAGKMTDKMAEATAMNALFGRGARQALGFINSDVSGAVGEFKSFGASITEEQGKANHAFTESKAVLNTMWEGFIGQVTSQVVPLITEVNEILARTIEIGGGVRAAAKSTADYIIQGWKAAKFAVEDYINAMKWIGEHAKHPLGSDADSGMRDPNGRDIIAHPLDTIFGGIFDGFQASQQVFHQAKTAMFGGSPETGSEDSPETNKIDAGGRKFDQITDSSKSASKALDALTLATLSHKKALETDLEKALEASEKQGVGEQMKAIIDKLDKTPMAKDGGFDSQAATVLQSIRSGADLKDPNFRNELDRNMAELSDKAQGGNDKFDHSAQQKVVSDLQKMIDKKTDNTPTMKWDIGIYVDPQGMMKWSASGEGVKVIDNRIVGMINGAASGVHS